MIGLTLHIVGIVKIIIAAFLFITLSYSVISLDGTVVWVEYAKMNLYFLLLLLSGIGILLKNQKMFICVFYLFGFLCFEIIGNLIGFHTIEKVNFTPEQVQMLYIYTIQKSVIYIVILTSLILFLSSKQVLGHVGIGHKYLVYKHILFSAIIVCFYYILSAFSEIGIRVTF